MRSRPGGRRHLRRPGAFGRIPSWGHRRWCRNERILVDIIRFRHSPIARSMPVPELGLAEPATIARYQPVIGLEVHVQLKTRTKIFSHSTHRFGEVPNSQTDPVVLGLPGALPVLNEEAVSLAVRASLAINCRVNRFSRFARKNYFYPDLPKGYQISQFDQPLAEHGWLDVQTDSGPKRIGVTRLHMEEDAGKTIHDGFSDSRRYSYVDLNRAGAPLCEIVSEPDLRSADEAVAYLNELKLLMQFAGVSDCDMEKGQLRCDANISVRPSGATKLGTRSEIKNLNSFRFVKQAIQYEIARQVAIVDGGGTVYQESRLFNTMTGTTSSMRGKEDSHDYRYFPEPDLPPLVISDERLASIRAALPELPPAMRARFTQQYGLSDYDARVLTLTAATAAYFERAAAKAGNPKAAANWVQGELMGALNAAGKSIADSPVAASKLGELVALIDKGTLSGKLAKQVFAKMFSSGRSAQEVIEAEGLRQISDSSELEGIISDVLARSAKQVAQYRGGKKGVIGYFIGQVMKATRGQANPRVVNQLLRRVLDA